MLRGKIRGTFIVSVLLCVAVSAAAASAAECVPKGERLSLTSWFTVVNNGIVMPDQPDPTKTFNSYNQPSVDREGRVVFRARSRGPSPVHGIYMECRSTVTRLADRTTPVPAPNNTDAEFNEFPSFPRIDAATGMMASRGNSPPVWEYTLDGTDTRVGNTGVFVANTLGQLSTAVNVLGAVPGFEYFQVPGASTAGVKFDVFPGSASPIRDKIVFKGNYTDNGVSETGVYYRDFVADKGVAPVELIANTNTLIPGESTPFGSTAPPSAAGSRMVFVGLDNEDAPTMGGIYLAPISPSPVLTPLVTIGSPVPDVQPAQTFTQFGEGLSFTGRYVAFWGAWGTETMPVTLACRSEGNAAVLAYCQSLYPDGYMVYEPVNQGIFVYDTRRHRATLVAQTTHDNFQDFMYWNFSGRAPGSSEPGELARWRSSAFVAVADAKGTFRVAFVGTKQDGTQGVYLADGPSPSLDSHTTVLDTTTDAQVVDPAAPTGLTVTSLGIERDGFRNPWLAITASMANEDASVTWGGIYLTRP